MTGTRRPISRDDLEAKFRELQAEVDVVEDDACNYAVVAASSGVVVVVADRVRARVDGGAASAARSSRSGGSERLVSWLDLARRNAVTEGLLGGNRRWLVLGGVAWGLRAVGWAIRRDERVLFRETLRPGETLVISERQLSPGRKRGSPERKGRKR